MPYYEFKCSQCNHTFARKENFEEHDRRKQRTCPKCGSRKTRQLVLAAYVQTSKKS